MQTTDHHPVPLKHVAILAFPFGTHAIPLLSLAKKISESSPDVHFSFLNTAKSNESIFSGRLSENIKPIDVDDGLPEGYVAGGNPGEAIELFLKEAPENFRRSLEKAEAETGKEIGCLLSDAFLWFCGDMAEEFRVPWVPLWTAGPRSLLVHVETDFLRQRLGNNSGHELDKTLDLLPGFSAMRGIDLPEGVLQGNLGSPFATMLHKMGHNIPKATAVAINSFEEIDPEISKTLNSKFPQFLNVGPLNLTSPSQTFSDEYGCIAWLDKHEPNSVAYISFGSFLTPPPHELVALAEVLDESSIPFLWSFRGNPEGKLPKSFLERLELRGKIVPWAPQVQVLRHDSVGVFVTHGGWNSVLESVVGGVPLICRPFIGDQKLNMRTLGIVWGIGMGASEDGVLAKSEVMKGLNLILSSKEGKDMRDRIEGFRKLALHAIEPNGSSSLNFASLVEVITK